MRTKLAIVASIVLAVVIPASPAHADLATTQPPDATSTAVTVFEATHKDRRYTLQQWDVPSSDAYIVRIFVDRNFPMFYGVLGIDDSYTYYNKKRKRFPLGFWKETARSSTTSTLETLFSFENATGFSLEIPRSQATDGTYTVLLVDDFYQRAQWDCSIYNKDVCRWKEKVQNYDWRALQFTLENQQVTSFRVKSGNAFGDKKYKKQIKKLLSK